MEILCSNIPGKNEFDPLLGSPVLSAVCFATRTRLAFRERTEFSSPSLDFQAKLPVKTIF